MDTRMLLSLLAVVAVIVFVMMQKKKKKKNVAEPGPDEVEEAEVPEIVP